MRCFQHGDFCQYVGDDQALLWQGKARHGEACLALPLLWSARTTEIKQLFRQKNSESLVLKATERGPFDLVSDTQVGGSALAPSTYIFG